MIRSVYSGEVIKKRSGVFSPHGYGRVLQKNIEIFKGVDVTLTFNHTDGLELFGVCLGFHKGVVNVVFENVHFNWTFNRLRKFWLRFSFLIEGIFVFLLRKRILWRKLFFISDEFLKEIFFKKRAVISLSSFFAILVIKFSLVYFGKQESFKSAHILFSFFFLYFFQLFFKVTQFSFHNGVPMIFDGVVCSSLDELGQNGPFVSVQFVQEKKNPLFLFSPGVFYYAGIEVVVPPFPALFALSIFHERGNNGPFGGAVLVD